MSEFETVDAQEVICPHCGKVYQWQRKVFSPGWSEANKGEYTCDQCGRAFRFTEMRRKAPGFIHGDIRRFAR